MPETEKPLAEKLIKWREGKGWSMAKAAREIGVSRTTWFDWEAGNKIPRGDKAAELVRRRVISHDDITEAFLARENGAA